MENSTSQEETRKKFNRLYNKRYYETHKETVLAKRRARYAAHKEEEQKRNKEWQQRNAERYAAYQADYYRENREARAIKSQSQYEVLRAYKKIMAEMEAEQ